MSKNPNFSTHHDRGVLPVLSTIPSQQIIYVRKKTERAVAAAEAGNGFEKPWPEAGPSQSQALLTACGSA
jgi:hypothetical protein